MRAAVVFGLLSALPFGFTAAWVQNLFIFTLMYAALASAWNIVGGYSGYISLGHAAFFGVGAYAVGIVFTLAHLMVIGALVWRQRRFAAQGGIGAMAAQRAQNGDAMQVQRE